MGYMQWIVRATQQNATREICVKKLMIKATPTTTAWCKQYKTYPGHSARLQLLLVLQIGSAPLGTRAPKDNKQERAPI